jgi:hypothetical protein
MKLNKYTRRQNLSSSVRIARSKLFLFISSFLPVLLRVTSLGINAYKYAKPTDLIPRDVNLVLLGPYTLPNKLSYLTPNPTHTYTYMIVTFQVTTLRVLLEYNL